MLVSVKATTDSGETLQARYALEMLNIAFEDLEKLGVVVISAEPTPRFAELRDDGSVWQTFQLSHFYQQPVYIDRVRRFGTCALTRRRPSGLSIARGRASAASVGLATRPLRRCRGATVSTWWSRA